MKKTAIFICCTLLLLLAGCSPKQKEAEIVNTVNTGYKTYYEMSDGTWQTEGMVYQYRLEISGRMPNAEMGTTFVYLSNLENITFEQAWKAAGLSSNTADYFSAEDAILVEWKTN